MKDSTTTTYAAMGLAALLPGMQHMVVLMQNQLDQMRAQLAALQGNGSAAPRKLGRPMGSPNKKAAGYWGKMTAGERSAEMNRRMEVRHGKRKPTPHTAAIRARKAFADTEVEVDLESLHPRDERSPRHKTWLRKIRKAQTAAWDRLSPAEKLERQERMMKGRRKAA